MRLPWLWVLLFALLPVAPLGHAQTFHYEENRLPLASMAGQWRFHAGDDPRFASPHFEDASWTALSSDDSWTAQGFPHLTGIAWYRFRIAIPDDGRAYSFALPEMNSGYECYVDGRLMVREGPMAPGQMLAYTMITPVAIPVRAAQASASQGREREVQVALRVYHAPVWASYVGGGPTPGSSMQELFGTTADVTTHRKQALARQRFQYSELLAVGAVDLLAGLASLALFLLRRKEREYLWFGIAVLAPGLKYLLNYYTLGQVTSVALIDGGALLATMVSHLAFLAFYMQLLQGKANTLLRVAVLCVFLNPVPLFLLEGVGVLNIAHAQLWNTLLQWPYELWILILLVRRAFQRNLDARLLLAPVAMIIGLEELTAVATVSLEFGHAVPINPEEWMVHVPFPVTADDLASGLFLVAMLLILLYRFARTRREEEQYAAEFASAREVQRLLVPDQMVPVTGFAVQAEYRPARIVGGDFYQVLPTQEGGLLIIVGDVAGKGLPAAMLVSMLVGVIRTQAFISSDPLAMLAVLNERLLGRAHGGFSTCVVANILPGGVMRIANAGHLSPYLNGDELSFEGALPLGLVADPDYTATQVQLKEADRLTFVTDGIPEAQNAAHQMLGFDRTRALSREGAQAIVRAAEQFGQEDDLTVVTVDLTAKPRALDATPRGLRNEAVA